MSVCIVLQQSYLGHPWFADALEASAVRLHDDILCTGIVRRLVTFTADVVWQANEIWEISW